MKGWIKSIVTALSLLNCTFARASSLGVHFGPPSLGSGGSNPLSIPPSFTDLGIAYLTDEKTEFQFSLIGIGFGKRIEFGLPGYLSLGGAIPFSINGLGLGVYSIFGWELFKLESGLAGNIEYVQMTGISSSGIVSPYSIRIGMDISW